MRERLIQNKGLILNYYLVAVIAMLLYWLITRNGEQIDRGIAIGLATYILVFPVVFLYTRKYALHIFLFLLAFMTGFYSFYNYSVGDHSVLNALYFTFQLYLIDITDVFTEDGTPLLMYPPIVEIARWSAASYTISTLFIAMYRLLEMSILLVFYQIVGNHYVVFGHSEDSFLLMKNLRKRKKRVIVVADNLSTEEVDELEELKIVIVKSDHREENRYVKSGLHRAKKVILFQENDIDNLNEFIKIDYYLKQKSNTDSSLSLFVHLKNPSFKRLFKELEKARDVQNRPFDVHVINVYERFVNQLFTTYPIHSIEPENEQVHVLIIGFGPMGQHIAQRVIAEAKDDQDPSVFITAVDQEMDTLKPKWAQQFPETANRESVNLQTYDITSETFESIIDDQEVPITHIHVCIHEEYVDLLAGIELSNRFPETPIYIEFSQHSMTAKWIESDASGSRQIYSTGTYKDLLTEEGLLEKNGRKSKG